MKFLPASLIFCTGLGVTARMIETDHLNCAGGFFLCTIFVYFSQIGLLTKPVTPATKTNGTHQSN